MSNLIRDIWIGFRKTNATANDPYRVVEMNAEDFLCYEVVTRKDCLVLYKGIDGEKQKLEIVVQVDINQSVNKASKVFSLMRAEDEEESQVAFCQMREKIPVLVDCVPELGLSKLSLQSVSQVIRDNPTWTAAHIAAHFGYTDCFTNKVINSEINKACDCSLQTPLHAAIKAQQLASVSALMILDARIDIVDCNSDSVFHYAATTTKEIIQALASKPIADVINMLNNDGHSPLYLACLADKPECVKELLKAGADANGCIFDTNIPTDSKNSPEVTSTKSLKDVLQTHTQKLFIGDMKNGGTPLHWAKTSEFTELLIEYGCHIDARNFLGDTALHLMVRHSRISCAVTLLSHGADADIPGVDNNTALHLAVKSGDIYLVYTFITFGANVNIVNNKGETPRHIVATERRVGYEEMLYALHIVGAERCSKRLSSCNEGCEPGGQFNGIPSESPPILKKTNLYEELLGAAMNISTKKDSNCSCARSSGDIIELNHITERCRVLCLDGGGIRGLVLIQLLDQLEKVAGVPIMQCFDWVSGTSTGGVLALLLASGKTVKECRCLYFRLKDKVFVGTRPYDAEPLEKFLKTELGENTVMSDIKDARVMVTATKADRHPAELHIFRNYDSPLEILHEEVMDSFHKEEHIAKPQQQLVWQAARATGAAPTYFRAFGQFLDGGLIANNPTLDTLTEIHQCNQSLIATGLEDKVCEIEAVVSLGTGRSPVVAVSTIDVFRPDSLWGACKMALGVSAISQLLVDQATQTDGRVTARAEAVCSMLNIPYYRLNPQLSENLGLDSTDTNTLVKVLWETTAYMYSIREELEQLAMLLKR